MVLPHVVVRICGPGTGPDIVAALGTHAVEVTEVRDAPEARRASTGRPATLVVVADPPDAAAAVTEAQTQFPGVPILIVANGGGAATAPALAAPSEGRVDSIPADQPIEELCWHVLEAASRADRTPGIDEYTLGPVALDVDGCGVIACDTPAVDGRRLRSGDSILSLVEPRDRATFAAAIARAAAGETRFCAVRLLNERGGCHTAAAGLHGTGAGRVRLLMQPLFGGGPTVGRFGNDRDPITGLLTRWAIARALEERERSGQTDAAVLLLKVDDASAIADAIGTRETDELLVRVASVLGQVFPHPALVSRVMGDAFLACMPGADTASAARRADRVIRDVNCIDVPGFAPAMTLRASIGIAAVAAGDHDLAIRLAEAAAAEAQSAGGNRSVVAGSPTFTPLQADELTADMELGSWEVWLQPVVAADGARPEFHEALARFDSGRRRVASRADFFVAGRAAGLLERFDRMMLLRALEILAARPDARISINVSHETFEADSFPGAFLDQVRDLPGAAERIILEIAPRCLVAPADDVRTKLQGLAAAGIAVAIDDFGSGICQLRSLTQFPLAIVKLDEFVTGYVDDDPLQREFVRTVVSLCRARGITTVAEFTRSPEQLARLVEDGIDLFQGELFGMPRPATEIFPAPESARG
jgi:diguanylate cyclase (GGDEF)-like protein